MTSKIFDALRNQRDPKTVMEAVIDAIREAERTTPLPEALSKFFDSRHSIQRSWGTIRGEITEIDTRLDDDKASFIVRLSYEDYCRGCFMGTETLDLTIPDELVVAYENKERAWGSDDWEADGLPEDSITAFDDLIAKFTADKVVAIQTEYEQAQAEAQRKAEADRVAAEAADRAKFEELKKLYG